MIASRRWGYLLAAAMVIVVGCRDDEPTPSHYRDLGDGARTLTPVGSSWHSVAYRAGDRADWVAFRELGAEAERDVADEGAGDATADTSEVETEIRDLIQEYNELAAERDFDEMLLYHAKSQRDDVRPLMDLAKTMVEKLDALREALEEKLPDEQERIAATFALIDAGSNNSLKVQTLTADSPTEVTGTTPPGSPIPAYKFTYADEEWSIEIPQLPDIGTLKPAFDMLAAQFDTFVQALASGAMPAETLLGQLETMAQMAAATQPSAGGEEDDGDEDGDEAEAPDDEEADEEGD